MGFFGSAFPPTHKPLLNGDVVTYILFALSGQIPDNQGSSEVWLSTLQLTTPRQTKNINFNFKITLGRKEKKMSCTLKKKNNN